MDINISATQDHRGLQHWLSGAAAGASASVATQWLYNIKLAKQKGAPISWAPRVLFAGTGAAAAGDMSCVAVQDGVYQSSMKSIQPAYAAFSAVMLSAIPLTACEMAIDHHGQNTKSHLERGLRVPSYWMTMSHMVKKHGPQVLFR